MQSGGIQLARRMCHDSTWRIRRRILQVESCPRILGSADLRQARMSFVVTRCGISRFDISPFTPRRPPSTAWEPQRSSARIPACESSPKSALPRILRGDGCSPVPAQGQAATRYTTPRTARSKTWPHWWAGVVGVVFGGRQDGGLPSFSQKISLMSLTRYSMRSGP